MGWDRSRVRGSVKSDSLLHKHLLEEIALLLTLTGRKLGPRRGDTGVT